MPSDCIAGRGVRSVRSRGVRVLAGLAERVSVWGAFRAECTSPAWARGRFGLRMRSVLQPSEVKPQVAQTAVACIKQRTRAFDALRGFLRAIGWQKGPCGCNGCAAIHVAIILDGAEALRVAGRYNSTKIFCRGRLAHYWEDANARDIPVSRHSYHNVL